MDRQQRIEPLTTLQRPHQPGKTYAGTTENMATPLRVVKLAAVVKKRRETEEGGAGKFRRPPIKRLGEFIVRS